MGGAVGHVAAEAVLDHRRVFPQIRSSYLGVAFETFQVDVLSVHQFIRNRSVAVVAVGAFDFTVPNRMAGLEHQLGGDLPMAGSADFGLGSPGQVLGVVSMDIVAVCTDQRPHIVRAVLPAGHFTLAVAAQTDVIFLGRRRLGFGAEGNNVSAFAFFGVNGTRSMAGLAHKIAVHGCRGPGITLDAVDIFPEPFVYFLVAFHACLVTDVLGLIGCPGRTG